MITLPHVSLNLVSFQLQCTAKLINDEEFIHLRLTDVTRLHQRYYLLWQNIQGWSSLQVLYPEGINDVCICKHTTTSLLDPHHLCSRTPVIRYQIGVR